MGLLAISYGSLDHLYGPLDHLVWAFGTLV
jgi:hypothetical protein